MERKLKAILEAAGRIAHAFISAKLTPLIVIASCCWSGRSLALRERWSLRLKCR